MLKSEYRSESVSEFLQIVDEIKGAWFEAGDPWGPWFRGQRKAHHLLLPSLYRHYGSYAQIRRNNIEDELREEFIVRAPSLSDAKPADPWEWYFLMQHFGAPTRLLDWTDGALIGMYFAVRDSTGEHDAAVWVLDPYELNRRTIKKEEVIPPSAPGVVVRDMRLVKPWLPARFTRMAGLPERPVAIYPTHIARRISNQRSCFTIHGTSLDGLDELQGSRGGCLVKIIIPSFRTETIRQQLDTCGVDDATIFPDLEGLSRTLAARWRQRRSITPHRLVYTRLRPSKVARGGVGIFAIRKIRKGIRIFSGDSDEMVWIEEKFLPKTPKEIRKLYEDFSVIKQKRYGCPPTFNRLTPAWYLNDSRKPNVVCDNEYEFFALRDIRSGEELTVDYSTYSDPPKVSRKGP